MAAEERWGTLAVKDHIDARALAADVLLYDRLVFPEPSDPTQRDVWHENGWQPDLLDARLKQFGTRAVPRPWDKKRRGQFKARWSELQRIRDDANRLVTHQRQMLKLPKDLRYQLTRDILAQSPITFPDGVDHVVSVAAYRSPRAFRRDFPIDVVADSARAERHRVSAHLTFLLGQRFFVPPDDVAEDALKRALEFSGSNETFQERRHELHAWQDTAVRKILEEDMAPEAAVRQMERLVAAYDDCVEKAITKRRWKFAFMLAGVGISLAGGLFNPLAAGGAFIAVAQFTRFDRALEINPGDSAPAAAVHIARKSLGWR